MDLPFMLDVSIGLILIFLILSLLISEIQELITTVLQWRAQHLKEAIEVLLAGGAETKDEAIVKDLVDKLYDDPLIKNINHEAKGLPGQIRKLTQQIIPVDFKDIFGGDKTTGPSYMPAETFTASFLEQTGLAVLARKLVEVRLESLAQRIVGLYNLKETLEPDGKYERSVTPLPDDDEELNRFWNKGRIRLIAEKANFGNLDLDRDFKILVEEFADIVLDFKNEENNLETSISRMEESLSTYIEHYSLETQKDGTSSIRRKADPGFQENSDVALVEGEQSKLSKPQEVIGANDQVDWEVFSRGLKSLKKSIFGDKSERDLASEILRPSLLEFAELLDKTSQTYQEVQKAFETLIKEGRQIDEKIMIIVLEELYKSQRRDVLIKQVVMRHPEKVVEKLKEYSFKGLSKDVRKIQNLVDKITSLEKKLGPFQSFRGNISRRAIIPLLAKTKRDNHLLFKYHKALRQRRRLLYSVIHKIEEKKQIELVKSIIESLNDNQKFSNLENDSFGLIDCALDHLSSEDRHMLIYDSITELKQQDEKQNGRSWSKEYELKQRSLYNDYETYKRLQIVLAQLPGSIKESFTILARRAQTRLEKTESDIEQFRKEVAVWFDQSMARTSGVYKRNAKGVSILLGISIAFILNVDTIYVVTRLTDDENLRRVITESAIELSNSNSGDSSNSDSENFGSPRDLDQLVHETDKVLKQMVLPIGWSPQNLDAQIRCSPGTDTDVRQIPTTWEGFYQKCLTESTSRTKEKYRGWMGHLKYNSQQGIALITTYTVGVFRLLLGWIISGIAISMGAPFWFDLLNRFINVRQAGEKPESTVDKSMVSKPSSGNAKA